MDCKMRTHFTIQESKKIRNASKRMKKILDANYKKANLKEIVNNLKYLSSDKRSFILTLLRKYEEMFDGTLGNYMDSKYKMQLLQRAKPYHAKPFPIPKMHKETFKTEVNRLMNIAVLKCKKNSKWEAPTFITILQGFFVILLGS